jgi:hypothetical protein
MAGPKKKNPYNGRDPLIQAIIKGVTKAGIQKDRKKEESKSKCRKKIRNDE